MTLPEPSKLRKAWDAITGYKHIKIVLYLLGALVLLGLILFVIDRTSDYAFRSKLKKDKEKIANEMSNIPNLKSDVNALQGDKANTVANVGNLTNSHLDAINATDEARTEVNRAVANLANAVNSNQNVNASAQDLEDIVNRLSP